jgi:hypothetical protein
MFQSFTPLMQCRHETYELWSGNKKYELKTNNIFLNSLILEGGKDRLFRDICNFQYTLRNIREERISHLLRGRSLKSHNPSVILRSRNSGDTRYRPEWWKKKSCCFEESVWLDPFPSRTLSRIYNIFWENFVYLITHTTNNFILQIQGV